MNMHAFLFATVLLAGCSQAPSNTDDTKAAAVEPAPMASETPAMATEAAAKKASATGTVEVVDATAGKITIAHGPVDALQWPAMTMAFKATPEQLASVQAGQKVKFEFESKGMDSSITQITPMK